MIEKPAKITLRNVLAVAQAYFRKGREIAGIKLDDHIYEQIIWRRTQVMEKSPDCWKEGHCQVCGCEILGKTMEDRSCAAPEVGREACYPEMMDKSTWEKYKLDNNIKLFS